MTTTNKDYLIYHMHSTYSALDSVVQPQDYVNWLKENGHTAVCFSEHGNISQWIKKKQIADKAELKYVHGCEVYLASSLLNEEGKKFRCNYHTILLAKNYEGVKELNNLVTTATDDEHQYYMPRITYDEFFGISNNIIKISACIGSPLYNEEKGSLIFNKLVEAYDFLEIQYHNEPRQIAYNKMLATLGKPLVVGTDTHSITVYDQECRSILMKAKGMDDDESAFDLKIKKYDEVLEMFKNQGSLSTEIVEKALNNTLLIQNSVEDFELDYTFKYPSNYEDEEGTLRQRCYDKIIEMGFSDEYYERVEEEIASFKKVNMMGFMLINGDMADYCKENNILIGYGRGSVGGSLVAYLLGVTDVDAIKWKTNFARFCNDSRVSLGDIDWDVSPEDRQRLFDLIKSRSGEGMSCHIGTFNKLSIKSIVDNVGRALNKPFDELAKIKDGYASIEKEQNILKRRHENGGMSDYDFDEAMMATEVEMEKYLSQFSDIFYYYKGLNGVIVAQGRHAAGVIGSPINVIENIGGRHDAKNGGIVSVNDMKAVDSVNFTKFDMLSLKTLQIVKHTFELINKNMPKAHDVDWNDKDVYADIGVSPVGLFQFESTNAHATLTKFEPKSVEDIALMSAVLRPSCDSFRTKVVDREVNPSPSEAIATMMESTMGFMVYQEQQIEFLQKLCGFSGAEADTIRRHIGKKDLIALELALPRIEAGYISNSDKDEETAKKECAEFIQVMKDSGSYGFNFSHAVAYSMLTYMTAYLRHYYPLEFVTSYLNNASDESDIQSGTQLAQTLDIEIKNPEYGKSGAKYTIKDKAIYKGMESILHISDKCSQTLSEVAQQTLGFHEVVSQALSFPSVNTRQIEVLIKVEFFKEFGCACKLHEWFLRYKEYSGRKSFKKEGIPRGTEMIIKRMIENNVEGFGETAKQYKVDSKVILDEIFRLMKNVDFEPTQKIVNELSYLGYIQTQELKSVKVGTVNTNKTKLGAFKIDFIDGSGAWYKFEEDKEPTKGMMISVITESQRKEGRYTQKYIDMWEEIILDRQTRK